MISQKMFLFRAPRKIDSDLEYLTIKLKTKSKSATIRKLINNALK